MMKRPCPLDNYYSFLEFLVQNQQNLPCRLKYFQPTNQQMAVPTFLRHTHTFLVRKHTVQLSIRSIVNLSSNKEGVRERDESEERPIPSLPYPQIRSPGHLRSTTFPCDDGNII